MKRFMPKPAQVAGGLVWLVAVFLGAVLFFNVTPTLEARFAPVLVDQAIAYVRREGDRVCWKWQWRKARYAYPSSMTWNVVVDGTAVEQTVVVTRERDGNIVRNARAASLGPGSNQLCAPIPIDLINLPALTIRGQIAYTMPHGLWTIWQEIPTVKVPQT
ncbi:hypothetical protein [Chelatococcus sp.]|uniref:hypothetical protein n=1 Tax=Chelatococcus sp. TaxID=1953771 RepID=UPI001EC1289F|nr:hypothetical protein [Chelatococcus sp.]MBX3543564.1 hypothetical protein [Chelatococcus sp.]